MAESSASSQDSRAPQPLGALIDRYWDGVEHAQLEPLDLTLDPDEVPTGKVATQLAGLRVHQANLIERDRQGQIIDPDELARVGYAVQTLLARHLHDTQE